MASGALFARHTIKANLKTNSCSKWLPHEEYEPIRNSLTSWQILCFILVPKDSGAGAPANSRSIHCGPSSLLA